MSATSGFPEEAFDFGQASLLGNLGTDELSHRITFWASSRGEVLCPFIPARTRKPAPPAAAGGWR